MRRGGVGREGNFFRVRIDIDLFEVGGSSFGFFRFWEVLGGFGKEEIEILDF